MLQSNLRRRLSSRQDHRSVKLAQLSHLVIANCRLYKAEDFHWSAQTRREVSQLGLSVLQLLKWWVYGYKGKMGLLLFPPIDKAFCPVGRKAFSSLGTYCLSYSSYV